MFLLNKARMMWHHNQKIFLLHRLSKTKHHRWNTFLAYNLHNLMNLQKSKGPQNILNTTLPAMRSNPPSKGCKCWRP